MTLTNPRGKFSFLRGGAAYSAGVVASPGFTIEHASFSKPLPWKAGFERVDAHLRAAGRPRQALCAVELRSPAPFTFDGFRDFNAAYRDLLVSWDVMVDGVNPVARTNVAPELDAPAGVSLHSFAFTTPAADAPSAFIVAGAGEIPDGTSDPKDVIRHGETSADAMAEKARFVMDMIEGRLHGLGADWKDVSSTNVYTVHDLNALLRSELLPRLGGATDHGITWYYTRPPIVTIEFEMDLRGGTRETYLSS